MFKLGSNRKLSPLIASKLSRSCPKTYAVFELVNDIASEMANLECSSLGQLCARSIQGTERRHRHATTDNLTLPYYGQETSVHRSTVSVPCLLSRLPISTLLGLGLFMSVKSISTCNVAKSQPE